MTDLPHDPSAGVSASPIELSDRRLVLWHFSAGLMFLVITLVAGSLTSLQMAGWHPFPGISWLSAGRWQMIESTAAIYGFLTNAFVGSLHWIVPRITGKSVRNRAFSQLSLWLWQVVVLGALTGIVAGDAQGIDGGETPVFIDPLVLASLCLIAANFLPPIIRHTGPLPESLWYSGAALVWIVPTYAIGNFVPEYFVSGVSAAAIQGMFKSNLMNLFLAPLSWGLMYYFVPALVGRPRWSRRWSLIAFWMLAIFSPLAGLCQYLFTPLPMVVQQFAAISAVATEFALLANAVNLGMTIWSARAPVAANLPLRWIATGLVLFFVCCMQGVILSVFTFQGLLHFTDFNLSHSQLLLFGVLAFWLFGFMTYLIPRLLKTAWYNHRLCELHFWFSTVGIILLWADLLLAGVLQGYQQSALELWSNVVDGSHVFRIVQLFAGLTFFVGQVCLLINFFQTWSTSPEQSHCGETAILVEAATTNACRKTVVMRLVIGLGLIAWVCYVFALPLSWSSNHARAESVKNLANPNVMYQVEDLAQRYPEPFRQYFGEPTREAAAELLRRGRQIYVGEGCWRCHSQIVRPVGSDALRWGPISVAWEYDSSLERPALLGTRRVGPDLSREGGRHSNDWHAVHLFQPLLVSPDSPMPEYPWFFDGTPNKPNAAGLSIIAYVQWLGSWLDVYPYYERYRSPQQLEQQMLEEGLEKQQAKP